MHYLHVSEKIKGNIVQIADKKKAHHLRDVLRLKPGENLGIFDGEGNEFIGKVVHCEKDLCEFEILEQKPSRPQKSRIAIACAIPRKIGMDEIIDKLTQLDIDVILPLETERSVVKSSDTSTSLSRSERWRKIARSSAEQSQRNTLPEVGAVTTFSRALSLASEYVMKLIPTLEAPGKQLQELMPEPPPSSVIALIGPEGDFTTNEVDLAIKAGFIPVTLGRTVLRVDTAALAVAGFLKFWLK